MRRQEKNAMPQLQWWTQKNRRQVSGMQRQEEITMPQVLRLREDL
jgi:hypothetical protein